MSRPCFECKEREVGCHSWCEKYAEERRKLDEKKKMHRKKVDAENKINSVLYGGRRKR